MDDHYRMLGVLPEASEEEIRRAYRILARRYHPDINPGEQSEEIFKEIAAAYQILSNSARRKKYDDERAKVQAHEQRQNKFQSDYERAKVRRPPADAASATTRTARRAASTETSPRRGPRPTAPRRRTNTTSPKPSIKRLARNVVAALLPFLFRKNASGSGAGLPLRVSVVEVAVTVHEAVYGVQKVVEIGEDRQRQRISVRIPPAVRTGSVVHLRSKENPNEDMVLVVRVIPHDLMEIDSRGLIIDLPITVREALEGSKVSVPTLESSAIISIPAGSQSGDTVRVRGKGAPLKNGENGDLLYRLLIRLPAYPQAPGLIDKARELEAYMEESVRKGMPPRLFDL